MSAWMKIFGGLTGMLFLVCLIIFVPFMSIWAINTLFPVVAIPYTLKTWFAILIFCGIFKAGKRDTTVNNS
ncbi:hypothetical protein M0R04_04840 [Candidatus Dojkabacteria bacterium]|jgi:hypothetical protein|nr:hypothetical protein [Candidatus Dojkabacteria bacterium]